MSTLVQKKRLNFLHVLGADIQYIPGTIRQTHASNTNKQQQNTISSSQRHATTNPSKSIQSHTTKSTKMSTRMRAQTSPAFSIPRSQAAHIRAIVHVLSRRIIHSGPAKYVEMVLSIDSSPREKFLYEVNAVYGDGTESTLAANHCGCQNRGAPPYRVRIRVPCILRGIAVHIWNGRSRDHKLIPLNCGNTATKTGATSSKQTNAVKPPSQSKTRWIQAHPVLKYQVLKTTIEAGTLHHGKNTITIRFEKPFKGTVLLTIHGRIKGRTDETIIAADTRYIDSPTTTISMPIYIPESAEPGDVRIQLTYSGAAVVKKEGDTYYYLPVVSGSKPITKTVKLA